MHSMHATAIVSIVGGLAFLVLMWLSRIAERITTGDEEPVSDDHLAEAGDMIEVGDDLDALDREIAALPLLVALHGATFTEDEYAKIVALHTRYHSAPTTGGDR